MFNLLVACRVFDRWSLSHLEREMAVSYAGRLKKNYNYGPCGLPEKIDPERVRAYKLKQICQLIDDARYIVVHTGAGISTASRIPDFRGPNGAEGKRIF